MYCHWRIELTGQPLGKKKMSQPQKFTSAQKLKKHTFPFMTTFCDFALKIETSWA